MQLFFKEDGKAMGTNIWGSTFHMNVMRNGTKDHLLDHKWTIRRSKLENLARGIELFLLLGQNEFKRDFARVDAIDTLSNIKKALKADSSQEFKLET